MFQNLVNFIQCTGKYIFKRAVNLIKIGFANHRNGLKMNQVFSVKHLLKLQCNKERSLIQFSLIIAVQKHLHPLNSVQPFDGLQVTAKAGRQCIGICLQRKVYGLMATCTAISYLYTACRGLMVTRWQVHQMNVH